MDQTNQSGLADTVGADVGRAAMLKEIISKVDGLDTTASDDTLDLWWGAVEMDRLASGLTLAAINKLSEASSEDEPTGPWLHKSDATGDQATRLTAEGREAIRQIGAAEPTAKDVTATAQATD